MIAFYLLQLCCLPPSVRTLFFQNNYIPISISLANIEKSKLRLLTNRSYYRTMNPDSINPREAIHLEKKTERKSFWGVWTLIFFLVLADFIMVGVVYLATVNGANETAKLPTTHVDRLFITKSATLVDFGEPDGISIDYKTFVEKAQRSETILIAHTLGENTLRLDAYCSKSNFVYTYVHSFKSPNSFTASYDYNYDPITGYFTVKWQRQAVHHPSLHNHVYFATILAVVIFLIVGITVVGNPFLLFRYPPEE